MDQAPTDVLTPEQRRHCMSRVRDRDTKPELRLRKALWKAGLRYRLRSRLPGKPDLVFSSRRVAVFMDSCFFHGCPVHGTRPKKNAAFWADKLEGNIRRDRQVNDQLRELGWTILRIWEHELRGSMDEVVARVRRVLAEPMSMLPPRPAAMDNHYGSGMKKPAGQQPRRPKSLSLLNRPG